MTAQNRSRIDVPGTRAYARWSPVNRAWLLLLGEDIDTAQVLRIVLDRDDAEYVLREYARDGWYRSDILSASEMGG